MTVRRTSLACLFLVALACLGPVVPAGAAYRTVWGQSGGLWDGIWENPAHWSGTGVAPDNSTGTSWWCDFAATTQTYYVELSLSHTVTYVTASTTTGRVTLANYTGERVWLQFATFTNTGALDVNALDLYGTIYNQGDWTMRGGMDNYNGDLTNYDDAVFRVKGHLQVKGDYTNDGETQVYAGGQLDADAFVNSDHVNLLGGALASGAAFANNVGALVGGAGSLYAGSGFTNEGVVAAETGPLTVYCGDGTFTSTGHLQNRPNTTLLISADTVDHRGTMVVGSGGGIAFPACDLVNKTGASIDLAGGTLGTPNFTQQAGAAMVGFGALAANVTNQGTIDLFGPSQILGSLDNQTGALLAIRNADLLVVGNTTNDGTIRAVNGKVYFEGALENNGTLDIDPSLAVCVDDLALGAAGVLLADAGSTYQLMGRFVNASTQRTQFDLAAAAVECITRDPGAGSADFEVAGRNLGAAPAAWTDNFALGEFRVGNATRVGDVRLVDQFNNPGDALPDALYVHDLTISPGSTLRAEGLTVYADGAVSNAGTMDLADGCLVIDYAAGATPLRDVLAGLAAGFHGGAWDGEGFASSAAAGDPEDLTALGTIDNADADVGGRTVFRGQPVDATAVLVAYTWLGDANLDFVVDINDYDQIDYYFKFQATELGPDDYRWSVGDFTYDGTIDINDYDDIDYAFKFQSGPLGVAAPVPEPATLALAATGVLACLWRRRRA